MTNKQADNASTTGVQPEMEDILFVFGSARGGTTYLSAVLTEWFHYGMGPEGTFIEGTVKKAAKLGDLSSDANCHALASEIINSETFQIIQKRWTEQEGFALAPEDILQRMPDRSLSSAIFAAYKVMADKLELPRVGNKNPGYWRELETINDLFPTNAKYLFIIRDGRDVALSLRHVPWGGHSVYEAASIWKNMIETVRKFEQRAPHGTLLTFRYEDLLNKPEKTINAIGAFIGEKNMEEISSGYTKAAKNNQLRSNFGKWRNKMSAKDQRVYEAVAGNILSDCGYECRYPDAKLGYLEKIAYKAAELSRKIRVNVYHMKSHLPMDTKKPAKSSTGSLVESGNTKNPN